MSCARRRRPTSSLRRCGKRRGFVSPWQSRKMKFHIRKRCSPRHETQAIRFRLEPASRHSTAAYHQIAQQIADLGCAGPGPCIMNTVNRSSAGSMKKNVPAMPLQKNWPTDPGNGAMPAAVRSAEAETKAVAGRHQGRELTLTVGSEVVGSHQLQRLAADDPGAVQRAAGEQHLGQAGVVHRGRDEHRCRLISSPASPAC